MNERRVLQRFSLELPIRMISTGNGREEITLSTSNICSKGAFIRAIEPYPVGTDLEMEIFLLSDQHGENRVIHTRGRVLRTEDAGMAVCFEENYNIEPCECSCGQ